MRTKKITHGGNSSQSEKTLSDMPNDIIQQISERLSPRSYVRFRTTSKAFEHLKPSNEEAKRRWYMQLFRKYSSSPQLLVVRTQTKKSRDSFFRKKANPGDIWFVPDYPTSGRNSVFKWSGGPDTYAEQMHLYSIFEEHAPHGIMDEALFLVVWNPMNKQKELVKITDEDGALSHIQATFDRQPLHIQIAMVAILHRYALYCILLMEDHQDFDELIYRYRKSNTPLTQMLLAMRDILGNDLNITLKTSGTPGFYVKL